MPNNPICTGLNASSSLRGKRHPYGIGAPEVELPRLDGVMPAKKPQRFLVVLSRPEAQRWAAREGQPERYEVFRSRRRDDA